MALTISTVDTLVNAISSLIVVDGKATFNMDKRTNYLKYVMGCAAFGFLFNMTTVLLLYLDLVFFARLSFAFCCLSMVCSIFLFFQEIRLSNEALKFHLSDMASMKKDL